MIGSYREPVVEVDAKASIVSPTSSSPRAEIIQQSKKIE